MSGSRLYADLARAFGWTPDQVDRMSYADIELLVPPPAKAVSTNYGDVFRGTWSARKRCMTCDCFHVPTATKCDCGGALRTFTAEEVEAEWARYRRGERHG